MVWFNCITAFRGNLDDAASHGPLAALPRFDARVTAGGRPPVRAGADLRAQRSRLALVRSLRERRFPSLGSSSRRQGGEIGSAHIWTTRIVYSRTPAFACKEEKWHWRHL